MRYVNARMFRTLTSLVLALTFSASVVAQNAESLYKAKCVACHAADGSGSAIGKKVGTHDFHSPEVQQQSDADLSAAIAKGKNKMPGYEKTLKPYDINSLVAYVRALGK
jgi:cytochrome c6